MPQSPTANKQDTTNARLYVNDNFVQVDVKLLNGQWTSGRVNKHTPVFSEFIDTAFNDTMSFIQSMGLKITESELDHQFTEAYKIYSYNGNESNCVNLSLDYE